MLKDLFSNILNTFDSWKWNLENLFFHRYDLIKIPNLKPWDFAEADYRIYYGIMEPIRVFMESEPEKHVCWYKDEDGQDVGHKYGECENVPIMFPELKGKYVMDLIKDVYHFYIHDEYMLLKEYDWLSDIWSKYLINYKWIPDEKNPNLDKLVDNGSIYSLNDAVIQGLDWKHLKKYDIDQNNFFDDQYVFKKMNELNRFIHEQKKHYMHLAVELHEYMWT